MLTTPPFGRSTSAVAVAAVVAAGSGVPAAAAATVAVLSTMRLPVIVVALARLFTSSPPTASWMKLSWIVSDATAPTLTLPEKPSPAPLPLNSDAWTRTVPAVLAWTTRPFWSPVNRLFRTTSAPPVSSSPAAVPSAALAPAKTKPSTTASVVTVSSALPDATTWFDSSVTLPPTAVSVILVRTVP